MSAPNRRNQISWAPNQFQPPEPDRAKRTPTGARPSCGRCLAGDCDMCVRSGCYHEHGDEVRRIGCTVPYTTNGPMSGSDLRTLRTEVDR